MGSSIRCERCGFVGFAAAAQCRQCGHTYPARPVQDYGVAPWQGVGNGPRHTGAGGGRKGLAVASLALGVAGLFTFGVLFVGAVVGLVLGIVALTRANDRAGEYGGRGLAIGGLVLNALSLFVAVPLGIVLAVAIPNFKAARRSANEAATLRTMRELISAEESFGSVRTEGTPYPPGEGLSREGLLEQEIPGGVKYGYRFEVESQDDCFILRATPTDYPNSGARSFYYSSRDGLTRAADRRGRPAAEDDPPLRQRAAPGGDPDRREMSGEPRREPGYAESR